MQCGIGGALPSVLFVEPNVGSANTWAIDSTAVVRPLRTADDVAAIDVTLAGSISSPYPITDPGNDLGTDPSPYPTAVRIAHASPIKPPDAITDVPHCGTDTSTDFGAHTQSNEHANTNSDPCSDLPAVQRRSVRVPEPALHRRPTNCGSVPDPMRVVAGMDWCNNLDTNSYRCDNRFDGSANITNAESVS